MKSPVSARGFTLIEVLVALTIVALGLTALFTTVNQTISNADYLREKTFATWIALNKITEARVKYQPPADDDATGELDFAGQKWRWELKTFDTEVEGIIRLEARAALKDAPENSWPGLATGFMGSAISRPQVMSRFGPAPTPEDGRGRTREGGVTPNPPMQQATPVVVH